METNKMREQFEAAYVEEMAAYCGQDIRRRAKANLEWRQENGDYRDPMVRLAYWAWQASREALVVELPARQVYESHADTSSFKDGFNRCHTESRDLIEAQGLKVAP
ncbi:hypothetical protein [Pseudomonas sp. 32_A]|uniref:hypothetical protein n=1 Tax=Pseudomonas sp. 32_A TaxID=2813559 RepID=UPI001A9E3C06|nr:hypothetical protein [Pseudomonas sp. 32_A]